MKLIDLQEYQPGDVIANIQVKVDTILIKGSTQLSDNKHIDVIEALISDDTASIIFKVIDNNIENDQVIEINNGVLEVVEGELRLVSRPPASSIQVIPSPTWENGTNSESKPNLSFNLLQYAYQN